MRTKKSILFRCRSIASLDVENISKKDSNDNIIEDEKGKSNKGNVANNTTSSNNRTNSSEDHIKLKDYKTTNQTRNRKQAINTWSGEEEPTGRGENFNNIKKVQIQKIFASVPNSIIDFFRI